MIGYILKRLAAALFVLFAATSITFLVAQFSPGNPFAKERSLSPEQEKHLREKFALGGTIPERYVKYLTSLSHGDLGPSVQYRNRSVNEILGQSMPVSLTLGAIAFVIATTLGIFLGTFAAVRRNGLGDVGAMMAALFAISIPTYVTGPIVLLIFAMWMRLLPVGGWNSLQSVILPSLVLATPYVAYIARLMRTSLIEVLNQDFVRTARAKGVDEWKVISKHALKVAILPVISYLGPLAANVLTGSLIVEVIFQIPGAGRFFIYSIINGDSILLSGVVIVYCTLVVLLNLLVDLSYSWLDRRIQVYG